MGSQGRVRRSCWAQPCCDLRALALCPVGAGTTPGPVPCQCPSLGWAGDPDSQGWQGACGLASLLSESQAGAA